MRKPSVLYLLIATAVMATCLAVHQGLTEAPGPFHFRYGLLLLQIRTLAFVVGVSMLMHVLTSLGGLSGMRQWAAAILVPTFASAGWYMYSVRYLGHHPGSLNVWDHIQVGLFRFTIGFALVMLTVAGLLARRRLTDAPNSTEQ